MSIKTRILIASLLLAGSIGAQAAQGLYTATVDRDGKVLSQHPAWIKEVKYFNQPNYFASYDVQFKPGLFKKAPAFCSVSSVDTQDNERLFYGHVKLGAPATSTKVSVLGLMVGNDKPAGDSSVSFQLACTH